jgi:hypothetical protein
MWENPLKQGVFREGIATLPQRCRSVKYKIGKNQEKSDWTRPGDGLADIRTAIRVL